VPTSVPFVLASAMSKGMTMSTLNGLHGASAAAAARAEREAAVAAAPIGGVDGAPRPAEVIEIGAPGTAGRGAPPGVGGRGRVGAPEERRRPVAAAPCASEGRDDLGV
jgi:hypothetical protein